MQLRAWLEKEEMGLEAFGAKVGASAEAVRLWINGRRLPNRQSMLKIYEVTGREVEANDFYQRPAELQDTG